MNVLDKSIVEAIRSAYAAPTPEGISSKSDERQGVMARTQSRVSKALKDTAQDAMASIQNLVGKTMEARTDKDVSMEDLAKQSAEENAKYRESMGITQSLTSSGGMLSTKDDQESAPVTVETEDTGLDDDAMGLPSDAGLMTRPKARPESMTGLSNDAMGLPNDDNYMGVLDDGATQDLLDRIALGEGADPQKLKAQEKHGIGTTPYEMVYNYGNTLAPDKPITQMTMKELESFQRKLINATKGKVKGTKKGTSAVGKYQVIKTSLFGANGTAEKPQKDSWADKLGLTADTIYTPAIQEKIGLLALKEAGYNSYINGKRSQNSFQNKIANIWASVAKADGTDKYGQGIHTVKKDLEPMFKALAPIKTEDTAVATSLRPKARP